MKARAIRLETFVKLSPEEFLELEDNSLTGELKVYDDPLPPRYVQIEIVYNSKQKKLLEVKLKPEMVSFCGAEEVKFTINRDYYNCVRKNGLSVERFFTSGKLQINIRERYYNY